MSIGTMPFVRGACKADGVGVGAVSIFWAFVAAGLTYGIPILFSASDNLTLVAVQTTMLVIVVSSVTYFVDLRCYVFYWLCLVLLQNVMAGFWHSGRSGDIPFVVTEAKTLSLVVATVLSSAQLLSLFRRHPVVGWATVFYFASLLLSVSDFSPSMLANLRNFVAPFLIVLLGVSFAARYDYVLRIAFVFTLVKFTSFWLAIGTISELVMGTASWRDLFSVGAIGGLNSLAESTSLFGISLSRTGGVLFEPINAGYIAASVIVILCILRFVVSYRFDAVSWWISFSAASSSLLFAATKNALLMFAIASLVLVVRRFLYWHPALVVSVAWLASFVVTLLYGAIVKGPSYLTDVWVNPIGASGGESTSIHMAGLISGFENLLVAPFGMGVGMGGNFYRLYNPDISRSAWLGSGSESSWGTLAFQAGILAIVGFVLLTLSLASRGGEATLLLLAVWSGASLFTEAFFGPIACSVLLLVAGLLWRPIPRRPS